MPRKGRNGWTMVLMGEFIGIAERVVGPDASSVVPSGHYPHRIRSTWWGRVLPDDEDPDFVRAFFRAGRMLRIEMPDVADEVSVLVHHLDAPGAGMRPFDVWVYGIGDRPWSGHRPDPGGDWPSGDREPRDPLVPAGRMTSEAEPERESDHSRAEIERVFLEIVDGM